MYVVAASPVAAHGEGGGAPTELTCEGCGFSLQFFGRSPDPSQPVGRCAVCGKREFYVQKDFNRRLGVALVVISGLLALLVMIVRGHIQGLIVLGLVTVVDAVIFALCPEVTVCYLCHSIYRGYPRDPTHRPFYQGNEERFKRVRQDWFEGLENDQ